MWYNLYAKRFLNQYAVCIKLILFVADTELELGVAKKKMADSEAGLFFVLFWFFSVLFSLIFFCIFNQDPQAFGSESVTSSDETFKSDRYVYGSSRVLYFRNCQLKYIFKKLYDKKWRLLPWSWFFNITGLQFKSDESVRCKKLFFSRTSFFRIQ